VVIIDNDEDDLPDSWEQNHFDNLDQEADNDYDGDSYTNLEEYSAGTDPTDKNDHPVVAGKEQEQSPSWLWTLVVIVVLIIVVGFIVVYVLGKNK
jgi:hypothetical protein